MNALRLIFDIGLVVLAVGAGVFDAAVKIVRHHRARATSKLVLAPDAPSVLTWSDLVTTEEVQAAARMRMLARFAGIAATMPDVRDLLDLYPAAEEISK